MQNREENQVVPKHYHSPSTPCPIPLSPSMSMNFHYAPQIQLPVCRQCRHAVWPDRIVQHLQQRRPHRLGSHDVHDVQREVQACPGLTQDRQFVTTIHEHIQFRVPQLELHRDGSLCTIASHGSRYVCRDEATMRVHFARQHPGQRGKRGARCVSQREKPRHQPWRQVCCQRIFLSRQGSQYFEVEVSPEQDEEPATVPPPPPPSKVEQARQMLESRMAQIKDRERRIIDEGLYKAPGPWLIRTEWQKYLRKLDRDELFGERGNPGGRGGRRWPRYLGGDGRNDATMSVDHG